MKLKQATQLAIVGVIISIIPHAMHFLANIGLMAYWNETTHDVNWYFKYLTIVQLAGAVLLLPFFIILFKSQKQ